LISRKDIQPSGGGRGGGVGGVAQPKMGAVPKSNQPKCHVDIELLGFLPLTAVINFDDLYSYYSD
jgi:hypothetical protein